MMKEDISKEEKPQKEQKEKSFKSLDEQIVLLKSRGLNIPDESFAKQFLYTNNYYRISGYSLTLRKYDVFSENATFQNIVDIYNFDYELRHILLKYIEIIEVSIKSIYAYEFSKICGATGYLDKNNFSNADKHSEILDKAEKLKERRTAYEPFLKHFAEETQQDIPLWAYIDLLTISDISFLYSISADEVKNQVARAFGLTTKGAYLLGRFIHSMTIIRNLCAHNSRLYNRLFEQKPNLNKQERKLLRKASDGTPDNAHLFGFILIMKRLLSPVEFQRFKNEILSLTERILFVEMRYYGFPEDWEKLI